MSQIQKNILTSDFTPRKSSITRSFGKQLFSKAGNAALVGYLAYRLLTSDLTAQDTIKILTPAKTKEATKIYAPPKVNYDYIRLTITNSKSVYINCLYQPPRDVQALTIDGRFEGVIEGRRVGFPTIVLTRGAAYINYPKAQWVDYISLLTSDVGPVTILGTDAVLDFRKLHSEHIITIQNLDSTGKRKEIARLICKDTTYPELENRRLVKKWTYFVSELQLPHEKLYVEQDDGKIFIAIPESKQKNK